MANNPLILTTGGDLKEIQLVTTVGSVGSNTSIPTEKAIRDLINILLPVGMITAYSGASAPSGWLLCDGSAVSRTVYASLFSVINTIYGAGDGTTTFNVPNAKGRVIVGVGQGSGLTNRVLGAIGGEEAHALVLAENGAHTHTGGAHSHTTTISSVSGGTANNPKGGDGGAANVGTGSGGAVATTSSGSGTPHNTMQPFIVLNYIIKI